MENLIITKSRIIKATPSQLWIALTQPEYTKQYMFNCEVTCDWKIGSTIEWKGNFHGYEAYQKGELLTYEPNNKLAYTTFDPNMGMADKPENYLTVEYEISSYAEGSKLTVSTSGFNGDTARYKHSSSGWEQVLDQITKLFEN